MFTFVPVIGCDLYAEPFTVIDIVSASSSIELDCFVHSGL